MNNQKVADFEISRLRWWAPNNLSIENLVISAGGGFLFVQ
jgi:hypothetical protein